MSEQTAQSQLRTIVERVERVSDFIALLEALEVWRQIPGWPGYEVSALGQVRSKFRVLTPALRSGYPCVSLSCGPKKQCFTVHRLVAMAFLGPAPFDGAQVAHNDGRVQNARVSNLRWASAKENQIDRRRHGTVCYGSKAFGAKLTEADIPIIRTRLAHDPIKKIAADYGVHVDTIRSIQAGRTWVRAGGSRWSAQHV